MCSLRLCAEFSVFVAGFWENRCVAFGEYLHFCFLKTDSNCSFIGVLHYTCFGIIYECRFNLFLYFGLSSILKNAHFGNIFTSIRPKMVDQSTQKYRVNLYFEKREEIWLSHVTKTPTPTEQSKKQRDNIKPPPKTLITQLLRTDLGRSAGVTAVTQLVWLNRFVSAQPSHSPQK